MDAPREHAACRGLWAAIQWQEPAYGRVTLGTSKGRMVYVVDSASVLGAQDSTV